MARPCLHQVRPLCLGCLFPAACRHPHRLCPPDRLIVLVGTDVRQLGSEVIPSGEHSIALQPQSRRPCRPATALTPTLAAIMMRGSEADDTVMLPLRPPPTPCEWPSCIAGRLGRPGLQLLPDAANWPTPPAYSPWTDVKSEQSPLIRFEIGGIVSPGEPPRSPRRRSSSSPSSPRRHVLLPRRRRPERRSTPLA